MHVTRCHHNKLTQEINLMAIELALPIINCVLKTRNTCSFIQKVKFVSQVSTSKYFLRVDCLADSLKA